jgi:hypothetical protein
LNISDIQQKLFRLMTVDERQRWGDAELSIRISDLRNAKADDFSIERAIKAARIRRHWIMATPQQTYELVRQAVLRKKARESARKSLEAA